MMMCFPPFGQSPMVVQARCTRCGVEITPVNHSKRFKGVNIQVTEITVSAIGEDDPYWFASKETLCSRCKDEYLALFNMFMKRISITK